MRWNKSVYPSRASVLRPLRAFALVAAISCSDAVEPAADTTITPPFDAEIAFTSTRDGSQHVYIATADGSQIKRLAKGWRPSWSPDGKRIAFSTFDPANPSDPAVRVVNVDGSGERVVTSPGMLPSWSPDGKKLVFVTGVGVFNGGIFVVNVDGTGRTRMLSSQFFDPNTGDWLAWPAWSPDGRTIAFIRTNYETARELYLMNADGSSPRLLKSTGVVADHDPSWSPDGTRLAFGSVQSIGRIGTVDTTGSDWRLYEPTLAFDPDWSPDGRSLVFNSFSSPVGDSLSTLGSRMRIYTIDLQTRAVRQLIPEAVNPVRANYWDEEAAWLRRR